MPNSAGTSTDADADNGEDEGRDGEDADDGEDGRGDGEDADDGEDGRGDGEGDGEASARAVPLPRAALARRIAPVSPLSMDMLIRLLMAGVLRAVDPSSQ
ncbi:hypothetical protein ACWD3Z_02280 [Streptomyces sp. NPDC002740]